METLSPADKARLMLNLPSLANRFVRFAGKEYPIIHLGIGDLELFRAACAPIEQLYSQFVNSELPLIHFIKIYQEEFVEVFSKYVPKAAAIVLGLPEAIVMASCCPVDAFCVVLAQWLHNQEIVALQALYPSPPDDDEDKELPDDPSANNPMGVVQKMASAYHWEFEHIIKKTLPQVYLMGNDAAWGYAKIKSGDKKIHKKPIVVDGKKKENFKGMNAKEYKTYLENLFQMEVPGVDQQPHPIGL